MSVDKTSPPAGGGAPNNLPLHTNKAVAIKKAKRIKLSAKSQEAIDKGDIQGVIDSLSPFQRQFCEEFLVDLNATQAVIRAGYEGNNAKQRAFQVMDNPAVRIAIDGLRAERSKNSDVTKDDVLKGIQKAIRKAEENNNINAMLRGYELLAKHLGMFVERTEISGPDGGAIEHKKIEEDVADFTRTIASIAKRSGESG